MNYSFEFFDEIGQESLSSAKVVVPLALDLLHPSSIVDIGCATGAWLSVFRDHGINTILGLDGSYVDRSKLLIPSDSFHVVNLVKPFSLSKQFDLALSLEVAEHLPPESANGFVQSLCQLAPIVLFSAAVPGQGGEHHMNEQWPEYWRQLFAKQHFLMFDPFRPMLLHDEHVAFWYRQNLFLFIRNDVLRSNPRFSQLPEVKDGNGLMLVQDYILFGNVGFRATLKRLPHLLWAALRRRVQRLFLKGTDSEETRPGSGRALR
jgi:hypothetical protein